MTTKHRILIQWNDQSHSTMDAPEEEITNIMRKLKDGAIVSGFWANPDHIRALLHQQYQDSNEADDGETDEPC